MDTAQAPVVSTRDGFGLWCGIAGVAAMVLFVVSNFALGDWDPPLPSASASEIADFFVGEGAKLEWAVGIRYVVFVLLAILLYGVARHVQGTDRLAGSFSRLALVGTAWLVATGTVANTLEAILIYQRDELASQPDLARLASLGMNALFGAAILPHVLIIGSLSWAALRTKTLPVLLIFLGGFQVATGLLGGAALVRTFPHDPFFNLTFGLSFFAFALWYLGSSLVLIVASSRAQSAEPALSLLP